MFVLILALLLLLYTYLGYPFLIIQLAKILGKEKEVSQDLPSVTLIIAAHNEQDCLGKKIENSLEIDYPEDRFQIIVASDCSSDGTNKIVSDYQKNGVQLFEQKEHLGKTAAQIGAVNIAIGEILVFSDASTIYQKDSIRKLVRNFCDSSVGCVGGQVIFSTDYHTQGDKNAIFDLEHKLRQAESQLFSTCVVSGCMYAVRNSDFEPIDHRIADDIGVPLNVLMRGKRVIYEEDAICYEDPEDHKINLNRNIRTINQGWVALELLGIHRFVFKEPKRFMYIGFILFGHKVCRWLSFILLILVLVSSIFCASIYSHSFFKLFLVAQVVFYGTALSGKFYFYNNKYVQYLTKFVTYHISAMFSFIKFCRGNRVITWS